MSVSPRALTIVEARYFARHRSDVLAYWGGERVSRPGDDDQLSHDASPRAGCRHQRRWVESGGAAGGAGSDVRRVLPGAARRDDRQRGAAAHRFGFGRERERPAVGGRRVRDRAGSVDAGRRHAGGPARPQAGGPARPDGVRYRIGRVRAGTDYGRAGGLPGPAGHRRGADAARHSGGDHQRVSGKW